MQAMLHKKMTFLMKRKILSPHRNLPWCFKSRVHKNLGLIEKKKSAGMKIKQGCQYKAIFFVRMVAEIKR
jgi:hypothetical protein